ncbi:ABC transporter ATP-binding protein [Desulfobacterium sp. N47]|uniref:Probable ribonucleotide transport ATP-binding protein mkl n=1 Tax=uncultured Desulfobacterium sp. TaxID=201089 RepID=E1YET3_9BACT|nr:Probable ribonucleotide transport ATP-binding protein mkl [uncultured Desulfobacterium sp.]
MGENILTVRNLVARYGDEVILNNINLDVIKGEILVILGGSGCGKSTLLRHMIGLSTPASGSVYVGSTDITECDTETFHNILKGIGVLFQNGALLGSMTVAENIALPIAEYTGLSKNSVDILVNLKLSSVELEGYEDYLPSQLSGGMKKRAGLARALALNPKILFLDEPTAGLDPVISSEIDRLVMQINEKYGTTIVIITHDLDTIFTVAKRVIMLDKKTKSIIAEGDPKHLKDHSPDPAVRRFFNRNAKV